MVVRASASPKRLELELVKQFLANGVSRLRSLSFSLLQLFEPLPLRLYSKEMHDHDLQDQQTNH